MNILPFPKKGDLRLAKNYRGITFISIAAKIYHTLLRNHIENKIDNILRKNQNSFRRNRSTTSQILSIHRILEGVRVKHLEAQYYLSTSPRPLIPYTEGRWSNYYLLTASPKKQRDTDYFDIVAGVLQGDTLAPYLYIKCLDFVLTTSIDIMKENGFKLAKERSRKYPTQTITDVDYADDLALLAYSPAQAESLLHSLEQAAAGKGPHVNADKSEYACFN